MTTTLEPTGAAAWTSLDRAVSAVREHLARNPDLSVGAVGVLTGKGGPGRVEVYVSAVEQQASCARLLAWLDTLSPASLILHYSDDDPQAQAHAELPDGTRITVYAPLEPTRLYGTTGDKTGDWVLQWLRWQAVAAS
ncbi:hypothetical protein [Actinokineospora inagensis]|uniref:hypothetical protein n=1 Tax=Actinokineospora inagensis TaxID=103730 RepID=UPI00041C4307|nr:hypothetical protein [Actinokineospora inagensis]